MCFITPSVFTPLCYYHQCKIFKRSVPEVISPIKRFGFTSEVYVLYSKPTCGIKDKDFCWITTANRNVNIYLYGSWVGSLLVSFHLVSLPFKLLFLFWVSLDSQCHWLQCERRVLIMAAVAIIDFCCSAAEPEKKRFLSTFRNANLRNFISDLQNIQFEGHGIKVKGKKAWHNKLLWPQTAFLINKRTKNVAAKCCSPPLNMMHIETTTFCDIPHLWALPAHAGGLLVNPSAPPIRWSRQYHHLSCLPAISSPLCEPTPNLKDLHIDATSPNSLF